MEQKVFLFMSFPLWFGSSGYGPTVLYLAANGEHAPSASSLLPQRQLPQRNRRAADAVLPLAFLFSVFWIL